MFKPSLLLLAGLFAAGMLFAKPAPPGSTTPSPDSPAGEKKNPPPLDPKNMDTSVKPQDDFYLYANGNWIKNNPVPPEYSRWAAFTQLAERNNEALHQITEKAAGAAPKDAKKGKMEKEAAADVQKVGDFYASGMNEKAVDAAGVKPLEAELKRIDSMKTSTDVLKEIAHLHSMGIYAFFLFTAAPDDKNSAMVIS